MLAMHKAIVVREFDKGTRPDFFDLVDFADDFFDRFHFVTRGQQNRTGAKVTLMGTAAAGLDGDAVVFGWIKQIEARHWRVPQIELAARGLHVERPEAAILEILEQLGPERLTLPYAHTRT